MKLKLLKEDYSIKPFDCGDADLNGFLVEDAIAFYTKRIGKTFIILDNDNIVAYFCLLNDKIRRFRFLDAEDKNKHTRLMYYDMLEM